MKDSKVKMQNDNAKLKMRRDGGSVSDSLSILHFGLSFWLLHFKF
jgi:hypothetical protein